MSSVRESVLDQHPLSVTGLQLYPSDIASVQAQRSHARAIFLAASLHHYRPVEKGISHFPYVAPSPLDFC